jgi:deoxyadenosine/deoxycytidine kinase
MAHRPKTSTRDSEPQQKSTFLSSDPKGRRVENEDHLDLFVRGQKIIFLDEEEFLKLEASQGPHTVEPDTSFVIVGGVLFAKKGCAAIDPKSISVAIETISMVSPFPSYASTQKVIREFLDVCKGKCIAIEGGIGSGKSTVVKAFTDLFRTWSRPAQAFEEAIITPYFGEMLQNPQEEARAYQMIMFEERRFTSERSKWAHRLNPEETHFFDSTMERDISFAYYHHALHEEKSITPRQYELYMQRMEECRHKIIVPDVIITLDCSETVQVERIALRDRSIEAEKYDNSHLLLLQQAFDYVCSNVSKDIQKRHLSFDNNPSFVDYKNLLKKRNETIPGSPEERSANEHIKKCVEEHMESRIISDQFLNRIIRLIKTNESEANQRG